MTNQEIYLSSKERRALKFTEQGVANAKIVAEEFGCVGPAFESFSDGLDRQPWLTASERIYGYSPKITKSLLSKSKRPAYTINQGYADIIGAQIKEASRDNQLEISKIEKHALSIGHYAAFQAFTDLPSYLEPEYFTSDGPGLGVLNNFYSPVISNYPELVDGDNEEGAVVDLHSRFAFTLANAALMIELEKRHSYGAVYVINEIEFADKAQYNVDPFPQELLHELITTQSLSYNQSYYEID